jgi:hypothetical protein
MHPVFVHELCKLEQLAMFKELDRPQPKFFDVMKALDHLLAALASAEILLP